jgi:uncharacterized protein (TIGR02147 family)
VNILSQETYQAILTAKYNDRLERNAQYSLRSFAQKLKMPPSALSEVLSGKRGISRNRAENIAKTLGMTPLETVYFVSLVESCHARSKGVREISRSRALKCRQIFENPLNQDHFQFIANWWHFAILELSRTKGFKACPIWISKKIGISVTETKEAVRRLIRLNILKKSAKSLVPTGDWLVTTPHDIPSEAIRKSHRDLIRKAFASVDQQEVQQRNLTSLIFAIDTTNEKKLQEAKDLIMEFNRKLNKISSNSSEKTQLYCFTTQLFLLEEN